MRTIAIIWLLTLAACSTPMVTAAGKDSITLKYDPALANRAEMQLRAEDYCREQGYDTARFVDETRRFAIDWHYASFHCEKA